MRRLCSEGNQPWKSIPLHVLSGVGETLFFRYNYDLECLNLSAKLPTFYKDIISHWQELNKVVPTTRKDVLDQTVWNNRFITINKAAVYFRNCHHASLLAEVSHDEANETTGEKPRPAPDEFPITHALAFP